MYLLPLLMPFTFSHPAFILPAKYLPAKYISITGLICGSIAPDFEYFFTMDVESIYSHTLTGILYFNIPVVFFLSLVFHLLIKSSFLVNMPDSIYSRFNALSDLNFLAYLKRNFPVFFISAIAGIASHIFIDSFTHQSGYFISEFPVLKEPCKFLSLNVPLFRFLQYFTSIAGLVFIIISIIKLPAQLKQKTKIVSKIFYWGMILTVAAILLLLRYYYGKHSERIGYWAINGISCSLIAITLVSAIWMTFRKRNGI